MVNGRRVEPMRCRLILRLDSAGFGGENKCLNREVKARLRPTTVIRLNAKTSSMKSGTSSGVDLGVATPRTIQSFLYIR